MPKGFDTTVTYDVVVTQGCGESCPFYAGARYEDWPLDDPKGQDPATVRRIVADIDSRVRALLTELVPDHPLPPRLTVRQRRDQEGSQLTLPASRVKPTNATASIRVCATTSGQRRPHRR